MVEYMVLLIGFLFGVIVGSFLNVVILRTHTKRSLGGHSHCMSCGHRLTALDLVPLLSYVALIGRCRHCGARISPRYFTIELTTGLLFTFTLWLSLPVIPTILTLVFLALLLIVFVYDIEHLIIPDEYVVALSGVAVLLACFSTGSFMLPAWTLILAPLGSFGFLGGLWQISGGRWIGLGDAKLSIPLAVAVGISNVFSLVVVAFWVGAVMSLTFLGVQKLLERGQQYLRFFHTPLTMKTEVPFAPFLIASYALVQYAHIDVFELTNDAMLWFASLVL